MRYVDELARELRAVGIRGAQRERILDEVGDHLRSDPEAESRFGRPEELANAFAADAGTTESRRAAVVGFGALAVAGIVYAIAFAGFARASHHADPPLASLAFFVIVLAPQIAFVAGALALLRAWRGRARGVLSSAERTVLARRTSLALGAGLATMTAVLVYAVEVRSSISSWVLAFTLAGAGAACVLLALAIVPSVRAARLRPQIAGTAGDVFDDLGLTGYRGRPWRFAVIVAGLSGLAVWVAGIVGADPIDGFIRGVFEGLVCLGGFALLGRYLSLRH